MLRPAERRVIYCDKSFMLREIEVVKMAPSFVGGIGSSRTLGNSEGEDVWDYCKTAVLIVLSKFTME